MIDFLKKNKFALIAAVSVIAMLAIAFVCGKPLSADNKNIISTSDEVVQTVSVTEEAFTVQQSTETPSTAEQSSTASTQKAEKQTVQPTKSLETEPAQKATQQMTEDKYHTDINAIPEDKPKPVEPQEQEIKDTALKCTIAISCSTILDNMDELKPAKKDLVPADGKILGTVTAIFNEGESVYDVLQRVCRENKIHMEGSFTPLYNTFYIEGINNIYEFDCGSLSGWRYSVNGWYPNYGCSRYEVKNGDTIEFNYTCALGYDLQDGGVGEQN